MYTLTINGNTLEELFANLENAAVANRGAATTNAPQTQPAPVPQQTVNPTPTVAPTPNSYAEQPTIPQQVPAQVAPAVATAPMAPTQPTIAPPPATTANPVPDVPTAAPTYTLDALARAGAALAQSGKMQEALALLAKYGVQTVNQLKPEQYGAFATELRALGAQV